MRHHHFDITEPARLMVRLPLGELRLIPGDEGAVDIELDGRQVERYLVEQRGSVIHIEPDRSQRIRWTGVTVVARVPAGTALHARVAACDLDARVALQELIVETASGDVAAGDVSGDAEIRSASGDIRIGDVGGRLAASAASGDIEAGSVSDADVKSASGDVTIAEIRDRVSLRSASGDLVVRRFAGTWCTLKSLSGDVVVGVTGGRRYDVSFSSLSGEIRTDFPVQGAGDAAPARIEATTVSGDIRIRGA